MLIRAMLCGHEFDTDNFPGYPDEYSGYCPECIERMKDDDDEAPDADTEQDANGVPMFDGDSFSEDDDVDEENVALDEYEEEEKEDDEEIVAEDTEEDEERDAIRIAEDIKQSLDTIYTFTKDPEPKQKSIQISVAQPKVMADLNNDFIPTL